MSVQSAQPSNHAMERTATRRATFFPQILPKPYQIVPKPDFFLHNTFTKFDRAKIITASI